jgi:hypothetical protein
MRRTILLSLIAIAFWPATASSRPWSVLGAPFDTAPWCVVYDIGNGVVRENCTMPNFAACNAERSIQGTTAFCRQNPAFAGYYARGREPQRRKHRRAYR